MSLSNCDDVKIGVEQLLRDENFVDEFVCQICQVHVVSCGPKLTKCSHLFCGDCLQEWFAQHPATQTWAQRAKNGGSVPCPVCKTALQKESDVYLVEKQGDGSSAMLWQMIQGLKIKCDGRQSEGGCCSWVGEVGSFQEHLESGACGLIAHRTDIAKQEIHDSIGTSGIDKQPPLSPSTCSLCSFDHSSADELSLECDSKDSETDSCEPAPYVDASTPAAAQAASTECASYADTPTPLATEIIGENLTSLIQSWIDIRLNEYDDAKAHEVNSCGESPNEISDAPWIAQAPESLKMQAQEPAGFHETTRPSTMNTGTSKKPRSKVGKKSSGEGVQESNMKQDLARAAAVRHWQAVQAYNWQAAHYQMAYAHRCQMAMYAAQVQHAMHCQKQAAGRMR